MAGRYFEISIVAGDEVQEGLSDFLFSEGALGLITEELPGDPPSILIRASFPGGARMEEIRERLERYRDSLRALGFSSVDHPIQVQELPILDWARISVEQFHPIHVGKRFTVAPPSHPGPFPPDRLLLRITPAMAFGTGYSPTTQMCLEGLEEFHEQRGGRRDTLILDIGTGTGILALAAAALGARQVIAIDTDGQACAAARENLALHPWADRIHIVHGSIEAVAAASRFDLILANLDTRILLPLFATLATLLAPAGQLVVGGITLEEEAGIVAAIRSSRLRTLRRRSQEGWVCLTLALERGW